MRIYFRVTTSIILSLVFTRSISQTVDKLRLVYDEKEIVSKQVGATVSNDGKFIAFVYANKVIKVVNLVTGLTILKFNNTHSIVFEIRFSFDGKKIISAGDGNAIAIFNLAGQLENSFTVKEEITKLAIGRVNNCIAIGQRQSNLLVYDLDSKKEVLNLVGTELKKKKRLYKNVHMVGDIINHISALEFHPKKNILAVAKFDEVMPIQKDAKNVEVYDLQTGKVSHKFGPSAYSSLSYSKGGDSLFLCGVGKKNMRAPGRMSAFLEYYDFRDNQIKGIISNKFGDGTLNYISMYVSDKYFLSVDAVNSFDVVDLVDSSKLVYTTVRDRYKAGGMESARYGVDYLKIYPLFDGKSFFINSFGNNIGQIYNTEKNNIVAYVYTDANDDFAVVGRDGRMDGDQNAISKLYWSEARSNVRIPIESTFAQFYTPKLMSQLLSGGLMELIKVDIENLKPVPEIKFLNPVVGEIEFRSASDISLVTETKTFKLEFSATDKGGGLSEIRVYQNGKLINTSIETIHTLDQSVKKVVSIDFVPGNNTIKIVATNADMIESSNSTTIKYTGVNNDPAKLFVVAIGINKYQKSTYDLNFAVPDATGFIEAIKVASKDMFADVKITFLQDEKATKQNVLKELEKVKPFIKQGDVFVFYYAGHGAMTIPAAGEQAIFNLVPNDVTNFYSTEMLKEKGISTSELQKISKEMNAQKQLFIIDACQSGGAVDALASRGALNEKELANLARSTGTYFLTASGSDQLAGEFAALGHGVFTYAILQAFTGKADGMNGDTKISVKELSLYVENAVPELSEKYKGQRQYPVSYGYGQDFLLVLGDKYKMKELGEVKAGKYSSYTLAELIKMKDAAVAKEDYETAKELKTEIEKRK